MSGVHGRLALVTGASEGIGRGIAIGLAAAGADLVLCARNEQALNDVAAECASHGVRTSVQVLDVTKVDEISRLNDSIVAELGHLDILVNSAGFSTTKLAVDIQEHDFDQIVDVGLKGLFFCCQILSRSMHDRGYGKVINLSSTLWASAIPGTAVYGAVKAAVSRLTSNLAVEWAGAGVRVNAIAPTSTQTPSRRDSGSPELAQAIRGRIPLARVGTVADLVPAAVYLGSSDSDFMTGHTLAVDGGWSAVG